MDLGASGAALLLSAGRLAERAYRLGLSGDRSWVWLESGDSGTMCASQLRRLRRAFCVGHGRRGEDSGANAC